MKPYAKAGVLGAVTLLAAWVFSTRTHAGNATERPAAAAPHPPASAAAPVAVPDRLQLSEAQARAVDVLKLALREFALQREAVGYIDFNQDRTVAVTPPWTGRVRQVFVNANDTVAKNKPLFSIDSPDLAQAESTLISSAGVWQLSSSNLKRAAQMAEGAMAAQKDLEQARSDQQTAEAAYKAARDAVRIFGKTDAEMDAIVATRKVDGELVIRSPIAGLVTARNAAEGLLVQPGMSPAPVVVSDVSTVWMVAAVSEYDLPLMRQGQHVSVSVAAYPGRVFSGEISSIGASADPATHRIPVRSLLKDPKHELRAQMLATFVLFTGSPTRTVAVPVNAAVRESDGSMSVFVTRDGRSFERRKVQLGGEQSGYYPVLSGLSVDERIAGNSALFLSNALTLQAR